MKKLLLAACCLLVGTILLASPARAADVLQEIAARLAAAPTTRGAFAQTRQLADIAKPLAAHGRFLVARDLGVIWETKTPFPQTLRLTRNEIVQTSDGRLQMRLSSDREPALTLINSILFSVFSGDLNTLAQHFAYSGHLDGDRWTLVFTPKDAALARILAVLTLSGGRDVTRVELKNATGDITVIVFSDLVHAPALADSERARFTSSLP